MKIIFINILVYKYVLLNFLHENFLKSFVCYWRQLLSHNFKNDKMSMQCLQLDRINEFSATNIIASRWRLKLIMHTEITKTVAQIAFPFTCFVTPETIENMTTQRKFRGCVTNNVAILGCEPKYNFSATRLSFGWYSVLPFQNFTDFFYDSAKFSD